MATENLLYSVIPVATGISLDLDPRVKPEDDAFGRLGSWSDTVFGRLKMTCPFGRLESRTVILEDRRQYISVVISLEMGESHPQSSFPWQCSVPDGHQYCYYDHI